MLQRRAQRIDVRPRSFLGNSDGKTIVQRCVHRAQWNTGQNTLLASKSQQIVDIILAIANHKFFEHRTLVNDLEATALGNPLTCVVRVGQTMLGGFP